MTDLNRDGSHILEGTSVILRKLNGSRLIQMRMRRNAPATVENLKFKLDAALIGKRYGIYNVKNGMLAQEATEEEISDFKNVCASNAETDEIEEANGQQRGNQVQLVREKVQLKQAKRALTLVQIERANPRLLAEYYYARSVETVGYLRADHIAYSIEMSGIIPSSRVLIFDQCNGVVATHVIERLNGDGHCVLLHSGTNPDNIVPCINACQFSKTVLSTYRTLPVQRLLEPTTNVNEKANENNVAEQDQKMIESNGYKLKRKFAKEVDPKQRELEDEALSWFKTDGIENFGRYDSLFVICRNADACAVLDKTLSAVRTSGTVVVYSPNSSVISAARGYLEKNACVFTTIRSFQQREIQVLKHRTHPLMQQLIPGGFILTGIRCYHP
ncbi:hypothetical protein M3Y97_00334700 [Aphelenchoides bicaudatus]|nr:hypothetical protein M3Y97_00334700 [Aphelenchoides bicaudatus]